MATWPEKHFCSAEQGFLGIFRMLFFAALSDSKSLA
jgi:hypothetical protein